MPSPNRKIFDQKFGESFAAAPSSPGTYTFWDEKGVPLYVGKAKNLRRRLSQYRAAKAKKKDRKAKRIVKEAARLTWSATETELEASLNEIALIQSQRPRRNVAGRYSFLYPFIGLRMDKAELRLCFTTKRESFSSYEWFGAFRSRELTGEAFFGLVRLLHYLGHPTPRKKLGTEAETDYSYLFAFRRLPEESLAEWRSFFLGGSEAALETLTFRLLDKIAARKRASEVQEAIDSLWKFWKEEIQPLRAAIETTGFADYPVSQENRDPLFIRARFK